jgi:N-acetylmuramoyl-L-alanine amidase CwlA
MESNKDLLSKVISQNTDLAKKQFELSLQFSKYQNAQELRFVKIESYLKSDSDTNTEGAIEKLNRIDKKLTGLEKEIIKKSALFGVGASGIVLTLKWIIGKIII